MFYKSSGAKYVFVPKIISLLLLFLLLINKPARLNIPVFKESSESFTSPKSQSLYNPSYPRTTFYGFKSF